MSTEENENYDEEDEGDIYEVEKVVGMKKDADGNELFRVRWKGYPPEEDTWEPKHHLDGCLEKLQEFLEKVQTEKRKEKEERRQKSIELKKKEAEKRENLHKERDAREKTKEIKKSKHKHSEKEKSKNKNLISVETPRVLLPNECLFSCNYISNHKFTDSQITPNANRFATLFKLTQEEFEKCPEILFQEESEPYQVKSISKNSSDEVEVVLRIDEVNTRKEVTVPINIAKKICPQLILTYLLEKWKAQRD